jgi:hypothetical protein
MEWKHVDDDDDRASIFVPSPHSLANFVSNTFIEKGVSVLVVVVVVVTHIHQFANCNVHSTKITVQNMIFVDRGHNEMEGACMMRKEEVFAYIGTALKDQC